MITLKSISAMMLALLLVSAVSWSCGSDNDGATGDESQVEENAIVTIGDRADLRASTRPSSIFSIDDFISAGWKKSRDFSIQTLPQAESASFGFYNRKDIEIRIYPSHEIAMNVGRESAEAALETEKLSGRGAGFSAVTLYGAYVVAGNTVMLCELSIQDCTGLIDQME